MVHQASIQPKHEPPVGREHLDQQAQGREPSKQEPGNNRSRARGRQDPHMVRPNLRGPRLHGLRRRNSGHRQLPMEKVPCTHVPAQGGITEPGPVRV